MAFHGMRSGHDWTPIGKQIDVDQNDIAGHGDFATLAIDETIGWIGAFQD